MTTGLIVKQEMGASIKIDCMPGLAARYQNMGNLVLDYYGNTDPMPISHDYYCHILITLILENQNNAKEPFALLMSTTTSETQLTLEEKIRYEEGNN